MCIRDRDSVEPFLYVAKLYGIRCANDTTYGIARLAQLIGNYLGGTLSLGVGRYCQLDTNNSDNGVYVVGENWEIIDREFFKGEEQQEYDFDEFVKEFSEIYGDVAFVALSMKDYENLALNVAELKRFLNQQTDIIVYYEEAVVEEKDGKVK